MIITQPLEISSSAGAPTGRWRLVETSDEGDGVTPLCDCGGSADDTPTTCGHSTPEEALACPVASSRVAPHVPVVPSIPELARIAFEAYGQATGGKTWDGKPIPPYDVIAQRTPHVARAWEAAVFAVLGGCGVRVP